MILISFVIGTRFQWQVSLHNNNINLYFTYIFLDHISNNFNSLTSPCCLGLVTKGTMNTMQQSLKIVFQINLIIYWLTKHKHTRHVTISTTFNILEVSYHTFHHLIFLYFRFFFNRINGAYQFEDGLVLSCSSIFKKFGSGNFCKEIKI
jgi:hypothetical protein